MPTGWPRTWAKPVTRVGAVEGLELEEAAAVDEAGDHLAHVVGRSRVGGHDAVQLVGVERRCHRLGALPGSGRARSEGGCDRPQPVEGLPVGIDEVVDDARDAGVHVAPAELLGADDLAGRGAHEGRPPEEDRALVAHDDRLVAHRRHVRTACRARAEHGGELGHARRREARLVVEDAPEVLLVGEDLVLHRQVGTAGVDEVDAGEPVLERHLLGAQVLLHGERVVGAALHRGVVGDDHALAPRDAPDPGDDARARVPRRRTSPWLRAGRARGRASRGRRGRRRGRGRAACCAARDVIWWPRDRRARPSPGGTAARLRGRGSPPSARGTRPRRCRARSPAGAGHPAAAGHSSPGSRRRSVAIQPVSAADQCG